MSELPFNSTFRVRYSDTDQQGHLYFANYLVYADEATCYFMEEMGFPAFNVEKIPCYLFTVNLNCDYSGECMAGEEVQIYVGYTKLGRSSAEVSFELYIAETGQELGRGSFTQGFVDKQTRKSCNIPGFYRKALMERHPLLK